MKRWSTQTKAPHTPTEANKRGRACSQSTSLRERTNDGREHARSLARTHARTRSSLHACIAPRTHACSHVCSHARTHVRTHLVETLQLHIVAPQLADQEFQRAYRQRPCNTTNCKRQRHRYRQTHARTRARTHARSRKLACVHAAVGCVGGQWGAVSHRIASHPPVCRGPTNWLSRSTSSEDSFSGFFPACALDAANCEQDRSQHR